MYTLYLGIPKPINASLTLSIMIQTKDIAYPLPSFWIMLLCFHALFSHIETILTYFAWAVLEFQSIRGCGRGGADLSPPSVATVLCKSSEREFRCNLGFVLTIFRRIIADISKELLQHSCNFSTKTGKGILNFEETKYEQFSCKERKHQQTFAL